MRITDLAADRRELDVLGARVVFNPKGLRAGDVEQITGLGEVDISAVFQVVGGCLLEWDIEFEDGKPVPATADGLRELPWQFVDELAGAMLEAVRPGAAEGNGSSMPSESPPTDSTKGSPTSPTSSTSSTPPDGPESSPGDSPSSPLVGSTTSG